MFFGLITVETECRKLFPDVSDTLFVVAKEFQDYCQQYADCKSTDKFCLQKLVERFQRDQRNDNKKQERIIKEFLITCVVYYELEVRKTHLYKFPSLIDATERMGDVDISEFLKDKDSTGKNDNSSAIERKYKLTNDDKKNNNLQKNFEALIVAAQLISKKTNQTLLLNVAKRCEGNGEKFGFGGNPTKKDSKRRAMYCWFQQHKEELLRILNKRSYPPIARHSQEYEEQDQHDRKEKWPKMEHRDTTANRNNSENNNLINGALLAGTTNQNNCIAFNCFDEDKEKLFCSVTGNSAREWRKTTGENNCDSLSEVKGESDSVFLGMISFQSTFSSIESSSWI